MLNEPESIHIKHIVVMIACHNRRDQTVAAVGGIFASVGLQDVDVDVLVFDDGSTDGTAERLRASFGSQVQMYFGDGSNFWAKSMAKLEAEALSMPNIAAETMLLWLNDDVVLAADALERMKDAVSVFPDRVAAGTMVDPLTGAPTYGGFVRAGIHPLAFKLRPPVSQPVEVDTINGNFVGLTAQLARQIGGIDGQYAHAWADVDYGIRAAATTGRPMLLPGVFGTCSRNPLPSDSTIAVEWSRFISIKGAGNGRSTRRLLKLASPRTWIFWWTATYVKWWLMQLTNRVRRSRVSPGPITE